MSYFVSYYGAHCVLWHEQGKLPEIYGFIKSELI